MCTFDDEDDVGQEHHSRQHDDTDPQPADPLVLLLVILRDHHISVVLKENLAICWIC